MKISLNQGPPNCFVRGPLKYLSEGHLSRAGYFT